MYNTVTISCLIFFSKRKVVSHRDSHAVCESPISKLADRFSRTSHEHCVIGGHHKAVLFNFILSVVTWHARMSRAGRSLAPRTARYYNDLWRSNFKKKCNFRYCNIFVECQRTRWRPWDNFSFTSGDKNWWNTEATLVKFGAQIHHWHTNTLFEMLLLTKQLRTWRSFVVLRLWPTNLTHTEPVLKNQSFTNIQWNNINNSTQCADL